MTAIRIVIMAETIETVAFVDSFFVSTAAVSGVGQSAIKSHIRCFSHTSHATRTAGQRVHLTQAVIAQFTVGRARRVARRGGARQVRAAHASG